MPAWPSPPPSARPCSAPTCTRPWRLTLAVPAAGAASGYLQARQRFCANFGWRGVYNFDRLGQERPVAGDHALAEDRRKAWRIAAASAAIGVGVALVAMSL